MNKFNFYDKFIIFILGLLSAGLIGGALQPARIVGIVLFPIVITSLFEKKKEKAEVYLIVILLGWLAISTISLIWTIDLNAGLKAVFYNLVHVVMFLLIVECAKRGNRPLDAIIVGWSVFVFLTVTFAVYEIISLNHLPMDFHSESDFVNVGGEVVRFRYASVTFGNYNSYITNLMFAFVFFTAVFLKNLKAAPKVLAFAIFSCVVFVVFVNGSRGGVLVTFIIIFCLLLFRIKYFKGFKFNFGSLFLAGAAIVFVALYRDTLYVYVSRFVYRVSGGGASMFSDSARMNIYESVLGVAANSGYLGFGAGGDMKALEESGSLFYSSHNLFLEVFLQYGIPGVFMFLLLLFVVFFRGFLRKIRVQSYLVFSSFLSLPILIVINSSYLLMPTFWCYLSSIFVISNFRVVSRGDFQCSCPNDRV